MLHPIWHVTLRLSVFDIFAVKIWDFWSLWGHLQSKEDTCGVHLYHHAKFSPRTHRIQQTDLIYDKTHTSVVFVDKNDWMRIESKMQARFSTFSANRCDWISISRTETCWTYWLFCTFRTLHTLADITVKTKASNVIISHTIQLFLFIWIYCCAAQRHCKVGDVSYDPPGTKFIKKEQTDIIIDRDQRY